MSAPLLEIFGVVQIYVSSSFLLFLYFSREKDFDSTQIFAVREFVREWEVLELSLFASLPHSTDKAPSSSPQPTLSWSLLELVLKSQKEHLKLERLLPPHFADR